MTTGRPSLTIDRMDIKTLGRGDMVLALRHLDPRGANVRVGTLGVVFEEANAYGDRSGPMVRWLNMGACNVYEGDCILVDVAASTDAG